ncbi:MAG: arsenite S-adenosylmethyltransferase, partial [Flavobacteriales bacterium]|nr:arsenite S-adenosylmethyltransferase [Flavobacteriales bacterium]
AFSEVMRVLRPGGHFSISDVVLVGELPEAIREAAEMYAGCVSGALQESEYLGIIHELGFEQVTVQKRKAIVVPDDILSNYLDPAAMEQYRASGTGIFSITVSASKSAAPTRPDTHKSALKAACCGPESTCC